MSITHNYTYCNGTVSCCKGFSGECIDNIQCDGDTGENKITFPCYNGDNVPISFLYDVRSSIIIFHFYYFDKDIQNNDSFQLTIDPTTCHILTIYKSSVKRITINSQINGTTNKLSVTVPPSQFDKIKYPLQYLITLGNPKCNFVPISGPVCISAILSPNNPNPIPITFNNSYIYSIKNNNDNFNDLSVYKSSKSNKHKSNKYKSNKYKSNNKK